VCRRWADLNNADFGSGPTLGRTSKYLNRLGVNEPRDPITIRTNVTLFKSFGFIIIVIIISGAMLKT